MCSCGLGVFPPSYVADVKTLVAELSARAVRVAIPLVYTSLNCPDVAAKLPSSPELSRTKQREIVAPRVDDLSARKGTCFACGKMSAEEGVGSVGL
jgi:hypothetical protein